jgi:type III secretion protein R
MNEAPPNLLGLVVLIAGLGLVPFFIIMTTAFLKIAVVMFLIRNALGIQQTPPNIVLYAIAMMLTVYTSGPMIGEIYARLTSPELDFQEFASWERAFGEMRDPVRNYLLRFTEQRERDFFLNATAEVWPEEARQTVQSDDLIVLIPSFVISELTRAFEIGFLLYLPFIVIDLVVSAILLSMGMFMVSPLVISIPFKLFLFVLVDGWSRLLHGLVLTYQ